MTEALLGGVLIAGVALIVEGLFIFGRMQIWLNYLEQLAPAFGIRLREVPSKSAKPTDGSNETPRRWWQRLRHDEPVPAPVHWDELHPEPVTEPIPAQPGPETVPTHEAITVQAFVRDEGEDVGRIDDPELARIFADADDWLWQMRHESEAA